MANEISHDSITGDTLYACRFQLDGNVFLSDGASDEAWGAGGNDADEYDVTMTEDGAGGHFVGSFDAGANIAAGVYQVAVYLQAGANPADTDSPVARGEMYWDGTAELNSFTLDTQIDDEVIGADGDSHEDLSDQMDTLSTDQNRVVNVYNEREPSSGVLAGTLARLAELLRP